MGGKRTAYEILDTLEETLKRYTDEENDKRLKERRDILRQGYEKQLKMTTDFRKKAKIELRIKEIDEAYDIVSTVAKREKYKNEGEHYDVSEHKASEQRDDREVG